MASKSASWRRSPCAKPLRRYEQECTEILDGIASQPRDSRPDIILPAGAHGFAIAGTSSRYSRALFARVRKENCAFVRLKLGSVRLVPALRGLVALGPGHSIQRDGCEFAFIDKCDADPGIGESW